MPGTWSRNVYMCACVYVYKYIFFYIIAHMVIVLGMVALGVRRKGIDGYGKKKNSEKDAKQNGKISHLVGKNGVYMRYQ